MLLSYVGQAFGLSMHNVRGMLLVPMNTTISGASTQTSVSDPLSNNPGPSRHAVSPCHQSETVKSETPASLTAGIGTMTVLSGAQEDCCENGCTMLGCHVASAILPSQLTVMLASVNLRFIAFSPLLIDQPIDAFFRPPIFS